MPLTFEQKQLANGLDIVAEINPDSHSAAVGLFVKTGSRDETSEINGVSHFLEHHVFKEVRDAVDLGRFVPRAGLNEQPDGGGVRIGVDLGDDIQAVCKLLLFECKRHRSSFIFRSELSSTNAHELK